MIGAVGPYRVLRSVARGGMAEVFEVVDPVLGEHHALKLLHRTGTALQRFHREYEAMVRLNHPNVVRVYQFGEHEGWPWLSMEMLDGHPAQVFARDLGEPGATSRTSEMLRVGHELARALDHLHRRGLVHRDLKSANVLILPDRRVKLVDFGTARVDGALARITRENEFLGTFAYASPEQLEGKVVDGRSDLYSLGVLLYRLFTGVLPFRGDSPQEIAHQHRKVAPRPMAEVVSGLPPHLDDLVLALLEKDPAMRPERGHLVADWLQEIAGGSFARFERPELRPAGRAVGRESEFAAVESFLDALRPASVASFSGPAGSDQGAMMAVVREAVARRGWRAVTVGIGPDDDLSSVEQMIADLAHGVDGPTVGQATAALRRSGRSALSPARRREVLRAIGPTVLAAAAQEAPLVVTLEGMRFATESLADLLSRWRATLRDRRSPALFVTDHPLSDTEEAEAVRRGSRSRVRIPLPPLDPHAVSLVVGSMLLRRPPPAPVGRQIHAASGGLPVFIGDVVEDLVAGGLLRVNGADENRVDWAAVDDIRCPATATAHGLALLRAVGASGRRVLEVLAVVGGEAEISLIAATLGVTVDEALAWMAPARAAGLLTVSGDVVALSHALAMRVVDETMPPARRALACRRVGATLVPSRPQHVAVLWRAGRYDEAVQFALAWATSSLWAGNPATALEALDPAVSRLDDRAPRSVTADALGRLWLLHALALLSVHPTDLRISRSLARAAPLCQTEALAPELALAHARVALVIGHYPKYTQGLREAWQAAGGSGSSLLASRIAGELGEASQQAGQSEDAATWFGRSRSLAIAAGADAEVARAEVGAARLAMGSGAWRDAERLLAKAIRTGEDRGDLSLLAAALPLAGDLLRAKGKYSDVLSALDRMARIVRSAEDPSLYVRWLLAQAACELDLHRLGRAQEHVDELWATLRPGEHLQLRVEAELLRGRIRFDSGEPREAERILAGVVERAGAAGLKVLTEVARCHRAEVLWARRRYPEADAEFRGAFDRLSTFGDAWAALSCGLARARATAGSAAPDDALRPASAYVSASGPRVPRLVYALAKARHAAALGRDPAEPAREARVLFEGISTRLRETEQKVLRLHPWARELRQLGV
jgi:tetratricopeptide (TPR) repeat protein